MALPYSLNVARSSLFALDPNGEARRDLLTSGVGERTVQILYPESFDALVPALAVTLAARPYADVFGLASQTHFANEVMFARETIVTHNSYTTQVISPKIAQEWTKASVLSHWVKGLRLHLSARFAAAGELEACDELAEQVVKSLWCTHYYLSHWAELSSDQCEIAHAMILKVMRNLGLQ